MVLAAVNAKPHGLALMLGWRRVLLTLSVSLLLGLLNSVPSQSPTSVVVSRALLVGLCAMLVFGLFEQWPARLPKRIPRWVLQLLGVVVAVPLAAWLAYWLTTGDRGFGRASCGSPASGCLRSPACWSRPGWRWVRWCGRAKPLRAARRWPSTPSAASSSARRSTRACACCRRRSQPHFLFNTLANVQALVDTGSPQAAVVLRSLIAYLRAAVPRLHEPATTLGQELQLVRAYLELMHMRMPDRLQFALDVDAAALDLRCPPMTLLTLVENAVRHGIDPSEEGGRIEIDVQRARWPLPGARQRHRRGPAAGGQRARHRPLDAARAPAAHLRRRCAAARHARSSRAASCAELDFPARAERRVSATPDRPDRRRRAAAARGAGAPAGAGLARAGSRRAGAQRPRGGRAVRGAAARRLLSRRAHAGPVGRRGGASHRPPRAPGVRHRVRPVRRAGFRAGRARLPGEAGRAGAPGRDRGAPAGAPAGRAAGAEHRGAAAAARRTAAAQMQRPAPLRWIRATVGRRCA